ncbi:hypothetical protein ACLOJK_017861 [Asimina triloba]
MRSRRTLACLQSSLLAVRSQLDFFRLSDDFNMGEGSAGAGEMASVSLALDLTFPTSFFSLSTPHLLPHDLCTFHVSLSSLLPTGGLLHVQIGTVSRNALPQSLHQVASLSLSLSPSRSLSLSTTEIPHSLAPSASRPVSLSILLSPAVSLTPNLPLPFESTKIPPLPLPLESTLTFTPPAPHLH